VEKLLFSIVKFWKENMIVDSSANRIVFPKEKIPVIEKEIYQIFMQSRQLKYTHIDLSLS